MSTIPPLAFTLAALWGILPLFASEAEVHGVYVPIVSGLIAAVVALFGLYVKMNAKIGFEREATAQKLEVCEREKTKLEVQVVKLRAEVDYLNREHEKRYGPPSERSEDFTG